MTPLAVRWTLIAIVAAGSAFANAQTRGELLYATHCVACHTTQIHWRHDKQAYDWDSLKFQVGRWQGNASLGWNEADITEVARHLNETIYRYPPAAVHAERVSAPLQQVPSQPTQGK